MSSPLIHAAHSPIAGSPQYLLSEDETTNYTQHEHNHLLHETAESLAGDLFLTILSPSSCTSHTGNDSFIHNPEDGPYTPALFSTPSYTGNNASDGYTTPSNHGSPSPPPSRLLVSTPKAPTRQQVDPRTSSPAKLVPIHVSPTRATTVGNTESLPDAHKRTHLSYTMAAASRDAWAATVQNPELPIETRQAAHSHYLENEALVQHYSAILYQMEILTSMQKPIF